MTVAICSFYTQRHTHFGQVLHDIDSVLLLCVLLKKSAPVSSVFEQRSIFFQSPKGTKQSNPQTLQICNSFSFLLWSPTVYCPSSKNTTSFSMGANQEII
jgi:hypothetical protein